MAISYPINHPTVIGIGSIQLIASQSVATSQSLFTYKQQIVSYGGERWEASVQIPATRRDLAEPWVAFLLSLRGQEGTFLLGDPNATQPQGTISSATLTGSTGDRYGTVTMTGSLLAGDYIQLGTDNDAKLHKVLQDQTGDGTLELFPELRTDYTDETVIFQDTKGKFRLKNNQQPWDINNSSVYNISFEAVEAL